MQAPILKEYYIRYLREIRGVKESTAKHYIDALNNISRFLQSRKLVTSDIYEVLDLNRLNELKAILFSDAEFIALNKRGHQMYSSGMNNYCKFAEGYDFEKAKDRVLLLDAPVPAKGTETTAGNRWKRSGIIRGQSLILAGYRCEIDSGHDSFIAEKTGQLYMEGHHAIPMRLQPKFENSLDIYANIVCLCPICHRRIHYGLKEDRAQMMACLYDKRGERLANSGIRLAKEEFIGIFSLSPS